ncbi:MAG: LPS assembly lipoprotein LptE [Beijerinckiaceae bacterium]
MRISLQLVIVALGVATLGGCVRPLHAPGAADRGSSVAQRLAGIAIEVRGDRLAHFFRNELEFELRGGAKVSPGASETQYRLVVVASQRVNSTLLDRISGLADAATLNVDAQYQLYRTGKAEAVSSGNVIAVVSYERSQQRFATVRAARDAEIQAARQLAEQLRGRVATYVASNP